MHLFPIHFSYTSFPHTFLSYILSPYIFPIHPFPIHFSYTSFGIHFSYTSFPHTFLLYILSPCISLTLFRLYPTVDTFPHTFHQTTGLYSIVHTAVYLPLKRYISPYIYSPVHTSYLHCSDIFNYWCIFPIHLLSSPWVYPPKAAKNKRAEVSNPVSIYRHASKCGE